MAKKIPTQDEKNAYHKLRTNEKMDAVTNALLNKSPSEIVLEQIKMTSFIQMCTILEKNNPNDTEFGAKIRNCIKTFNENNT